MSRESRHWRRTAKRLWKAAEQAEQYALEHVRLVNPDAAKWFFTQADNLRVRAREAETRHAASRAGNAT